LRYLFIMILMFLTLNAKDDYVLGEGFQVSSLPFYIGGYFSLDYERDDDSKRYRLDDIAILGYGNYKNFFYMAEFEYKEFYVKTIQNDNTLVSKNRKIYTERLYFDYDFDENYKVRFGKYNSPIGFWNLLPINILRETTSSPMSSSILFPKFTTGLDLVYTSYDSAELKVNMLIQNNNDIDVGYNNYEIDKHYGFGLSYEKDEYTLKVNAGYFHDRKLFYDNLYYLLVSAKYESQKYQILTELGTQRTLDKITTNYAGYIQGLYRFSQEHLGVIRLESYDDKVSSKNENFAVLGYTYRPTYPVAIKSEYQIHSKSDENKILFSVSVLF